MDGKTMKPNRRINLASLQRSGQTPRLRLLLVLSSLALILGMALSPMAASAATVFPDVIPLPNGFQPEGIAIGRGNTFYAGSIPTGAIFKGDLRTGEGQIFVPPQEGRSAIGMKLDQRTNYLFVAGGPTGMAFIYNGEGQTVAAIQLTTEAATFVNDVVVTREAAYFTESFRPVLYRVPLLPGGELPDPALSKELPLSGDFDFQPGGFNANGIDATPNGKQLVIVNTTFGSLFTVDPQTGATSRIDLHGGSVVFGDGILLDGKTLYVVRNQANEIAVVSLSPDLSSGVISPDPITSPFFDVPTTIGEHGNSLYAVNARFSTPPAPDTEYSIVRVEKR